MNPVRDPGQHEEERVLVSFPSLTLSFLSVNPFPTNDAFWRHETFSFMMSHPAMSMSLGDRLCASRKGGVGGGGWVHPKGANSMAVSGLSFEQPLVGAG